MMVQGNVFFRNNFKVIGRIDFIGSKVNGFFQFLDTNDSSDYKLDLRGSKLYSLRDEDNSWPAKGNLLIDGLEYDEIFHEATLDVNSRIDWLRLQPDGEFHPANTRLIVAP